MSGAPIVRSKNVADPESRPVLVPAGNKARLTPPLRKPVSKLQKKVEKIDVAAGEEKTPLKPAVNSPPPSPSRSVPMVLRRQDVLLHSNLSLNASCSSDCSTDSFRSRASTGRIGSRASLTSRRKQSLPRQERVVSKHEKIVPDGIMAFPNEVLQGKRKCPWVTRNTEPCYATFHDEEWGVPVHDDKKLFELLVLSGALAELTWPVILNKRHVFREVFMDFDPLAVAKLNEKKITAQGSTASSLLSEPKLRAIIEDARQILKIIEEFGSFDRYCWNFVNNKPIVSRFRYSRQVPVKTPKADVISKDLVRRGFRCVGPTVIYSFMQVAGITNDHLISCYRFEECCASGLAPSPTPVDGNEKEGSMLAHLKMEEDSSLSTTDTSTTTELEDVNIELELARIVGDVSI